MGCGVSHQAPGESTSPTIGVGHGAGAMANPASRDNMQDFWIAGSVQADDPARATPHVGPFPAGTPVVPSALHQIIFKTGGVRRDASAGEPGAQKISASEPFWARSFFPHPLPCYSVGWARLDITPDHPHHNCRKLREKEKERERLGILVDYSSRRKFFIYPERIPELGIFLSIDNKPVVTDVAISSTNWPADCIPGAFFTFSPDSGSLFGDNALLLPLRPSLEETEILEDRRWARLAMEFNRVIGGLKPGTHVLAVSLKFRYGNTKFTAWRGHEGDRGVYRYTDEDRQELAISAEVARGIIRLEASESALRETRELQPRFAAAWEASSNNVKRPGNDSARRTSQPAADARRTSQPATSQPVSAAEAPIAPPINPSQSAPTAPAPAAAAPVVQSSVPEQPQQPVQAAPDVANQSIPAPPTT